MPKSHSSDIDRLIQYLSKIPGLGPRSARRAVLMMLKKKETIMVPLAEHLLSVSDSVGECQICGNLDTHNPCHVCEDVRRDASTICVVEEVADLWALDRSEGFKGLYHVLGGTLSALDGIGPDQLNVASLMDRVSDGTVSEVILALNATVDGQTTSHYLSDRLSEFEGVSVTALAHGLPVGGELDYLDDGTLMAAIKARSSVE